MGNTYIHSYCHLLGSVFVIRSLASRQENTTLIDTSVDSRNRLRVRLHDQMARIKAGVASGKLTKDQAHALIASLKAVREQMQADFTTNGSKELTPDQLTQLNQVLDANSKLIYGEKHDTDSTSPTGSAGTSSAPPAGN